MILEIISKKRPRAMYNHVVVNIEESIVYV